MVFAGAIGVALAQIVSTTSAHAAAPVVGKVTWPADINITVPSIWTLGTGTSSGTTYYRHAIGAAARNSADSATPTAPVWVEGGTTDPAGDGPFNVAVSGSSKAPGIYFTNTDYMAPAGTASAEAKARYGYDNTALVNWAPLKFDILGNPILTGDIVSVEVPIPSGSSAYTCGMEVNPVTNELVVMNACTPVAGVKYHILDPGPDGDPTTISDNSYRLLQSSGGSGGALSDMTLDAAGNIYNMSSYTGTAADIIRTDGTTGVVSNIGSFTADATAGSSCRRGESLAFYDGHIVNVTNTQSCDSMGVNPLKLKSTRLVGTNYSHVVGLGTPWLDGAGVSGAIALEGSVVNASGGAGLSGQTVAVYRDNGDGTATLAGYRTTDASGKFNILLDSDNAKFYARVVQPKLTTSSQIKNGEVVGITTAFTTGGSETASTLATTAGENGVNQPLGTVDTTKINIADTTDLAIYDVKDAKAVANVKFTVKFEGSTADLGPNSQLTTTATTGYGPQHVSVDDDYRLGATNGSYLIGATDNSHGSDDGVTLKVNGSNLALNNQIFAVNGSYQLTADSQGNKATDAKINAWASTPGATTWPATSAISSTTGDGLKDLIYTAPSTTGGSTLRFNTSGTAITDPHNTAGVYAADATSTTKAWTTAGEVEDYKATVANAVVRLKASGLDDSKSVSWTLSGAGVSPTSVNSTGSNYSAPAASSGAGANLTATAAAVAGRTLTAVNRIDSFTGVSTPVSFTGSAATIPVATGSDSILEFVYSILPDLAKSNFTVGVDPAAADGAAGVPITVALNGAANEPATGWAAKLTATASPNTGVTISGFTDNNDGTYTAVVTSTKAGAKTISVSYDGSGLTMKSGGNATATFTAGAPDSTTSTITIDSADPVLANGTAAHTVTLTLADANSNPVSGKAAFLTPAGSPVAFGPVTESGTPGTYTFTVTSTVAGSQNVSAFYSEGSVLFTFGVVQANYAADVPSVGDSGTSLLEAVTSGDRTVSDPSAQSAADSAFTHQAKTTVRDANNNPVAGAKVTFTLPSGLAVVAGGTNVVTTGADGEAAVWLASAKAGSYTVTAAVTDPASGTVKPTGGVSFSFVPEAPAFGVGETALTSSGADGAAIVANDGTATHTVTVTVRDRFTNVIAGVPVTIAGPAAVQLARASRGLAPPVSMAPTRCPWSPRWPAAMT